MRRRPLPLVLPPLEWKALTTVASSADLHGRSQNRTVPEGTTGVAFGGTFLYLRPLASGEISLGMLRPTDRAMPLGGGRLPDYQTAVHLIEHARNLGPLPRPAAMLVSDARSFVRLDEDESRGRMRIYTTVRDGGSYVLTLRSHVMTLEFQEDDEPGRAHDLMSLHTHDGYSEIPWPDFLAPQSHHVAMALRLIELHEAAWNRAKHTS
jgi:hypothetical protein